MSCLVLSVLSLLSPILPAATLPQPCFPSCPNSCSLEHRAPISTRIHTSPPVSFICFLYHRPTSQAFLLSFPSRNDASLFSTIIRALQPLRELIGPSTFHPPPDTAPPRQLQDPALPRRTTYAVQERHTSAHCIPDGVFLRHVFLLNLDALRFHTTPPCLPRSNIPSRLRSHAVVLIKSHQTPALGVFTATAHCPLPQRQRIACSRVCRR